MKQFSSPRLALAVALTLFAALGIAGQVVIQSKGDAIQRKDVQRELKLTPDQVKKIEAESSRFRQALQDSMQAAMPRQGGGGGAINIDMRGAMQKLNAEHKQRLNAILTDDQEKRYRQCVLQIQGISAVLDADVQKALGLTKEQIKDIAEAQMDNRMEFHAQGGNMPSREEIMQRAEKNRRQLQAALEKIVTADQKSALKKMAGPTFKRDSD